MDIQALQNLDGHVFEKLIVELMKAMGFRVERSKLSGDGGIDIIVYCDEPVLKGKYIVQCKRQTNPVGEPIIRDLYGTVMSERAAKGILITTSDFSAPARRFARDKPLELISGDELLSLLKQKGLTEKADNRGIYIHHQYEQLISLLNRAFHPIYQEVKDIEKGYIILPQKRKFELHEYFSVKSPTRYLVLQLTPAIFKILNDLHTPASQGSLGISDMKRLLKILTKHIRAIKDEWIELQSIEPPDICKSIHEVALQLHHDFLIWMLEIPNRAQQKIAAARAGDKAVRQQLASRKAVVDAFDFTPYAERMGKAMERFLQALPREDRF